VKRNIIIFVIALPFIISFAVLIASNHSAPVPESPLPNPNGYDKFIEAAGMLQGQSDLYDTMSEPEVAALVATNAEALALARSAFSNECQVPVQSAGINNLTPFKNLAQTMTAEGRLAELQGHSTVAAEDYLDVIHFGTEAGRGGFMTDALIGAAIEDLGQNHLKNLVNSFGASSCREIANTLEFIDSHRQTWADVLEKEDICQGQHTTGLLNRFSLWLSSHKEESEIRKKSEKLFHEKQGETRSLTVQFAARAYELDKGKPPKSITDLVPTYLKAIPQDPTTGKDMVYPP